MDLTHFKIVIIALVVVLLLVNWSNSLDKTKLQKEIDELNRVRIDYEIELMKQFILRQDPNGIMHLTTGDMLEYIRSIKTI